MKKLVMMSPVPSRLSRGTGRDGTGRDGTGRDGFFQRTTGLQPPCTHNYPHPTHTPKPNELYPVFMSFLMPKLSSKETAAAEAEDSLGETSVVEEAEGDSLASQSLDAASEPKCASGSNCCFGGANSNDEFLRRSLSLFRGERERSE